MNESVVAVGLAAAICVAVVFYVFLKKVIYNVFDPLIVVGSFIPLSAALLAVLCYTDVVGWDKGLLFAIVLIGYLAGGRTVSAFLGRESFRQSISKVLMGLRSSEVNSVLVVAACVTLILSALALQAGAAGDARQEFARLFRPLVVIQNGLFLFSLVLLASPRLSASKSAAWVLVFVVLSVPYSGKAVVVPALYWYGLRLYIQHKTITVRAAMTFSLLILLGTATMGILAYGAGGVAGILDLFTSRAWLSGDVYIYAYGSNALDSIRSSYPVSFLSYMMHPVTSLVGIRGYDKPLGAMLASEVAHQDLLTGPNPQLPVVLDYFFPHALFTSFLIAFVIGFLVIGVRSTVVTLARGRSRYLALGGIVAAIFVPVGGFLDTSQCIISVIGIAAVGFIGIALELLQGAKGDRVQT